MDFSCLRNVFRRGRDCSQNLDKFCANFKLLIFNYQELANFVKNGPQIFKNFQWHIGRCSGCKVLSRRLSKIIYINVDISSPSSESWRLRVHSHHQPELEEEQTEEQRPQVWRGDPASWLRPCQWRDGGLLRGGPQQELRQGVRRGRGLHRPLLHLLHRAGGFLGAGVRGAAGLCPGAHISRSQVSKIYICKIYHTVNRLQSFLSSGHLGYSGYLSYSGHLGHLGHFGIIFNIATQLTD